MPVDLRTEVGRLLRFGSVGLLNTLLTGAAFIGLSVVIDPALAYTIVYVLGLIGTTIATSRWVFARDRLEWRPVVTFVGWYLAVYVVGLGVLWVAQRAFDLPPPAAAALVIVVTAPLNYLGGRFVFARDPA